jgi:leucyl/phenylalanyl-tRNA--protein transferase
MPAAQVCDAASATASASVRFAETRREQMARWALGVAYACQPKRVSTLPSLLLWSAADILRGATRVPDPQRTRPRPDTFGGVCRGLSPGTVLSAARLGFFPWCHIGPMKWWTREQRMVMRPAEFRLSKTTRQLMKKNPYRVTFDTSFDEVMRACSGVRRTSSYSLTWITPHIMRLYSALHEQGHAHSFEVWSADGRLVGGGYGLAVGRVFVTESMFSLESNTSKFGFASLNWHLAKWGFVLNDGKDWAPNLSEAGMALIPRAEHEAVLAEHAQGASAVGSWKVESDLAEIAKWKP